MPQAPLCLPLHVPAAGLPRVRPCRLAAGLSATLACAAAVASPVQAAGGGSRRPPAVRAVLAHLSQQPMTVQSQAMQYDSQPSTPLPACARGLTPEACTHGCGGGSAAARDHFGRVIAGLLLAACGGLDAAHNLVTPLCWGSWTAYAGAPIPSSPAASEAAYVHAIIHRQEGACDGEFGSGFSNAGYWYRAAAAGAAPCILPQLLKEAAALAKGKPACEAHIARHGASWQPHRFVNLCSEVASGSCKHGAAELLQFCEGVMAAELRLLLDHTYRRLAGS